MSIIIEIKVVPRSKQLACKLEGERLKCFIKSAPEKGKANRELISYLAKKLGVKTNMITIMTGATSPLKRLRIETNKDFAALCAALGIERQTTIF